MWIWYILVHALGLVVGALVVTIFHNIRTVGGTLRIDHTNPEKDVYRIEIEDLDALSTKTHIELKIDNYADLSQK